MVSLNLYTIRFYRYKELFINKVLIDLPLFILDKNKQNKTNMYFSIINMTKFKKQHDIYSNIKYDDIVD
ncbi:Uncharacterised protein [Porphyromonas macacae]|uniref:Uncharacterized protein n=1 Tax=Porphyromonas macacae TaxID=28115 RepID=A0A379DK02_9PORP|nr:Uncharacterised protein [Porphyromonas macacae]